MTDNYQPQLKNNTFLCFHCRQSRNYSECSLDFVAYLTRPRWLICDECYKEITLKASQSRTQSQVDDKFKCYISGITYNTKQELALELEANDYHELILISAYSLRQAVYENYKQHNWL